MRSDIMPGVVFPDYELTDHTAKRRRLSELQGPHPMVLVLSRGGFCPKDRRQAELLVQLHRELEVAYCSLVTISTDHITLTNEYRTGVGAHWPFLSDAGRIVQKDLDIAEYTDPANNPHDSPCHCFGTGPRHTQDLQRLLVLRSADDGGPPSGPPCRHPKVPARLGYHHPGNESRLERRPQRALLPLWQDLCANARRAGLKSVFIENSEPESGQTAVSAKGQHHGVHPDVTRPAGSLTVHSHGGKRGSEAGVELGVW